jgi:hypothetical protein
LRYTLRGQETVDAVEAGAIATLQTAIESGQVNPADQPIVELRLEGSVGFDRLDLDLRQLQQQLQTLSGALIFLLKFEAEAVEFSTSLGDEASRTQIEQEVFLDMLTAHSTYKKRAGVLAQGLIDLKDQQLEGRSEPDLYDFVRNLIESEPSECIADDS